MKLRFDPIRVEIVQVRLFDIDDGPRVAGIFQRETGASRNSLQATLYQSPTIKNDWSICFWRDAAALTEMKSLEAVRCAELLRSIGLVDHAVWRQVTGNNEWVNRHSLKSPLPAHGSASYGQQR
ncbi:MAG: hypothetical protein MUD16_15785 [Desulfobacterales bacterium]|jgi:hypothetical protein|nr:hypothetical protein [Desulfobacterales bacterium]